MLEATLILPMFFALLIILFYLMITASQLNTQLFVQLTTVERAAFIWDEYDRDFASGIRQTRQRYNVYENDQLLNFISNLFSVSKVSPAHQVTVAPTDSSPRFSRKLKEDKLMLANHYVTVLPKRFSGELTFKPNFISRTAIELEFKPLFGTSSSRVYTSAAITDATQHIRGVDLLLYYVEKFKEQTNKEQYQAKGKNVIPSY